MAKAPIRPLPSQEYLLQALDYDPLSGRLTWRVRSAVSRGDRSFNSRCGGRPAGGLTVGRPDGSNRYLVIGFRIGGKYQQFQASRIIWKMMTGQEPPAFVDHKDRSETNLSWDNLRPATNGQNKHNGKIYRNNKSGIKGVCWDDLHKAWRAYISVGGRQIKLGRFKLLDAAARAVESKRAELHGDFARAA